MAQRLNRDQVAELATVLPETHVHQPTIVDRSLELPPVLYGFMVGLFLAFLGVMALGFANPELAIPLVIFALSIVVGFGIPTIWATMKPEKFQFPLSWDRFRYEGIMTASGRLTASEATTQVLLMPAMIFLWGIVVVAISAFS